MEGCTHRCLHALLCLHQDCLQALPHHWALCHQCPEIQEPVVFSQPNMTEILFLILYKAKGDITEREGRLERVTALCLERFVLHCIFCLDLIVSWLFPATRQGRRDGNMFPVFGQERPRASRVWPLQCLFFFPYNWPRCWELRLWPSWPVEHLPLVVQHVTVSGTRLGTVPGTVFLWSRLFCPVAFQESKAREKKAGSAVPPSGDGGRDGEPGSAALPGAALPEERACQALQPRHTTEKRETAFWSVLLRKQPRWMFTANKSALTFVACEADFLGMTARFANWDGFVLVM